MKSYHCYILYSNTLNRYYTGFTTIDVNDRLEKHLNQYYSNKYTSKVNDWKLYLDIVCDSIVQAREIEAHIKKMKSRVYIENLKRYPEMVQKLLIRYNNS